LTPATWTVCIDPLPSYIWYQDTADFADQISDERAGRRLARAIQGKGAFRWFKAELHEEYPHLLPAWYAFRDARRGPDKQAAGLTSTILRSFGGTAGPEPMRRPGGKATAGTAAGAIAGRSR
jgi:hypothetical protein